MPRTIPAELQGPRYLLHQRCKLRSKACHFLTNPWRPQAPPSIHLAPLFDPKCINIINTAPYAAVATNTSTGLATVMILRSRVNTTRKAVITTRRSCSPSSLARNVLEDPQRASKHCQAKDNGGPVSKSLRSHMLPVDA